MYFAGIGLAASVALFWGLADTVAAIAARRIGTMKTTLVAQAGGLITLALVGVLAGGQVSLDGLTPTALIQSVLFGVLLGIVSAGAYLGLYRSLELGPLVIVSPVVGGQGGVTLVLAVCFLHDPLDPVHLLLLLLILCGIVLSSTKFDALVSQGRRLTAWLSVGVRYALLSMLCFGILSFGFGAAATQIPGWYLVLFWSRLFSLLFLTITTLVSSMPPAEAQAPTSWAYLLAAAGGIVEVGGYIAFVFAAQFASTAVAGVCASLVPLIPLAFGALAYHERVNFNQFLGIALALGGLIALPLDQQQGQWILLASVVGVLAALAVKRGARLVWERASAQAVASPLLQPWEVPTEKEAK